MSGDATRRFSKRRRKEKTPKKLNFFFSLFFSKKFFFFFLKNIFSIRFGWERGEILYLRVFSIKTSFSLKHLIFPQSFSPSAPLPCCVTRPTQQQKQTEFLLFFLPFPDAPEEEEEEAAAGCRLLFGGGEEFGATRV
jgi:hypothetical protein